ncbi:alpha/beta fold hydrolase [Conexibacter woesei]|uniref:Alpha/beta hydrolase fold protein n=1 Tax=Conexibacter woesei (strain DSM 14684 / CCUG 47730 / CIP 108061 / JCM 11494 / NBRC 100937 / ID131577) TaxID=469383 RepID=D3F0T5_CONWI|nr:alpha/beta hydrolase [Conexibacter woesei]ADB54019.1 alpha/beta hydrolase fold protein [Conexibacter woesei DSM 14684]
MSDARTTTVAGPAGRLAVHVTEPAGPGSAARGARAAGGAASGGETVLLVHPANLGGCCWTSVAERLAGEHGATCVAIDLRGHGGSDRRGPFGVAEWADDCAAVLDALELPAVHLVGASVGAAVAVELAVRRPAAIRSLTTVGGAFLPAEQFAGPLLDAIDARGPEQALREHAAQDALAPGSDTALADRVAADLSVNDAATAAAIWLASLRTDFRPLAGALRAPALAVVGEHDTTCPPDESAAFARLTGARLELLDGIGHLPMYEAPARLAALLAAHAGLTPDHDTTRSTRWPRRPSPSAAPPRPT